MKTIFIPICSFAIILVGALYLFMDSHRKPRPGLSQHPIRQLDYWPTVTTWPNAKVLPPNEEVLEYLRLDGENIGLTVDPRSPDPQAQDEFAIAIKHAIATVPSTLTRMIGDSIRAIIPVLGLGSTALTVQLHKDGEELSEFVIFFDPKRLEKTSNEWLTEKDRSPFHSEGRYKIESTIARSTDDHRAGWVFILLHELAHVLGHKHNMHPKFAYDPTADSGQGLATSKFAPLSWRSDGRVLLVRSDDEMVDHGALFFYAPSFARLENSDIVSYYSDLVTTQFPTLYATTNMYDDFAESLATYIHTEMLRQPYQVAIVDTQADDQVIFEVSACWREPRCQAKRKVIESFLQWQP